MNDRPGVTAGPRASWWTTLRAFIAPPVLRMLVLGLFAGLPSMLVFGTLSIWLTEAGVARATVTMLSWAALAYSFKFVWAPMVDRMSLPGLTGMLGRRRAWLLVSQLCLIAAMLATGFSDPATALTGTALGAVAIAFSSATQDIVIDAYRIEAADEDLQSMMSAMYIAGYRIGMLVSGAGALWLASWLEMTAAGVTSPTLMGPMPERPYDPAVWRTVYAAMAAIMGLGVLNTLLIPEPKPKTDRSAESASRLSDHWRLLAMMVFGVGAFFATFVLLGDVRAVLAAAPPEGTALIEALFVSPSPLTAAAVEAGRFALSAGAAAVVMAVLLALGVVSKAHVRDTYLEPVTEFFSRYGRVAVLILLLIGTYRISDVVMGAIANVFYTEMRFTKFQIATYTKVWGLGATLVGGFVGGVVSLRWGVMTAMLIGAVLAAATNLLFAVLFHHPGDELYLFIAITADNLAGGLASAAFVAYLSALTNVRFTAMQYALFSSLMTLFPKVLAGYSGSVATAVGYDLFFIGSAVIGLPVVALVFLAGRYAPVRKIN